MKMNVPLEDPIGARKRAPITLEVTPARVSMATHWGMISVFVMVRISQTH